MILSYVTGGNVKETRRAKAQALRDLDTAAKRKLREEAAKLTGTAREKRAEKRKLLDEIQRVCDMQKADVRYKFDEVIERLLHEAEEIRSDLRGRALRARQGRDREKDKRGRTGTKRRESREESDQAVRNDVESWDKRFLPLWEKVKRSIKADDRMSRFERFQHFIHENPDAVSVVEERAANDAEDRFACEQAEDGARHGEPGAREWHDQNCDEDNRPRRRQRGKKAA